MSYLLNLYTSASLLVPLSSPNSTFWSLGCLGFMSSGANYLCLLEKFDAASFPTAKGPRLSAPYFLSRILIVQINWIQLASVFAPFLASCFAPFLASCFAPFLASCFAPFLASVFAPFLASCFLSQPALVLPWSFSDLRSHAVLALL